MKLAQSMRAIANVVRLLRESDAVEIVRVKDRFTTPSAGGWRDVMINYKLKGDSHVCEVQICHNSLVVAHAAVDDVARQVLARDDQAVVADLHLAHVRVALEPVVCLLYTSPSPRDRQKSRMPSSA